MVMKIMEGIAVAYMGICAAFDNDWNSGVGRLWHMADSGRRGYDNGGRHFPASRRILSADRIWHERKGRIRGRSSFARGGTFSRRIQVLSCALHRSCFVGGRGIVSSGISQGGPEQPNSFCAVSADWNGGGIICIKKSFIKSLYSGSSERRGCADI